MPVVAVVAVVVAVLTLPSVGVVVAVDCGPAVKVIGVVVLSKTYTVTFAAQQNLRHTPVSFSYNIVSAILEAVKFICCFEKNTQKTNAVLQWLT